MQIKRYNSSDALIWNEFVNKSKNGLFMFDRNYMDYHADRFIDNSLMFYEKDELVALFPANFKDTEIISHGGLTYGGFIADDKMKQQRMLDCFSALLEYARGNNITRVIYKTIPHIFHKLPAEEELYGLFKNNAKVLKIEPATTLYLQNMIKMPKGRKAQIARAKREKVIVEKSQDFEKFMLLEKDVLNKRHNAIPVHNAQEMLLLKSRFPNNIELFTARYNDDIIAGAIVYIYETAVHTQYLAASDIAREIGGLDLVIAEMIERFKDNKKYLDFGISSEAGGIVLNNGLISQKEGFGGRSIAYSTWEINI